MSKITGILLAAGESHRFGQLNKLLQPVLGESPMIISTLHNLRSVVDHVVVVIRPHDDELLNSLKHENVSIAHSRNCLEGMGSSIAIGINNSLDANGWIITLADMPFVPPSIYEKITQHLISGSRIARPFYKNKPGHPVGFHRELKAELLALNGEQGAKLIINKHLSDVHKIPVNDLSVCHDIDTPYDLAAANQSKHLSTQSER